MARVEVRNTTGFQQILRDFRGDETILQPNSSSRVDSRFVESGVPAGVKVGQQNVKQPTGAVSASVPKVDEDEIIASKPTGNVNA